MSGRKRHVLVDTLGLLLAVVVHAASVQDRDGARQVLGRIKKRFARLKLVWADGGYAGALIQWAARHAKVNLEIVRRSEPGNGFQVLPHRWIVERTLGWLGRYRRLSKDYECLPQSSENMIYWAMINLMVHRLKPEARSRK